MARSKQFLKRFAFLAVALAAVAIFNSEKIDTSVDSSTAGSSFEQRSLEEVTPLLETSHSASKKHKHVDHKINQSVAEAYDTVFNYLTCIFGAFAVFLGLAVICDDYLCPPIDILCERFKIPDDIAGATLLAFGSSAPEIFMNISATAKGHVDLSLPAILGSAIIAFGFIPAVCALSVNKPMELATWPIVRDSGMFVICLIMFWKMVEGGTIDTAQSAELTSLYFVYLGTIFVPVLFCSSGASYAKIETDDDDDDDLVLPQASNSDEDSPDSSFGKTMEIFSWPFHKAFSLTVPTMPDNDGADAPSTPKIFLAIILSLIWITILSSLAVDVAQFTSTTVGMSPTTAGATLLAFGAQVPDTFGSLAMAKNNMAGGAVANAVGSQVINISLGVGAPFLAYNLFLGKQVDQGSEGDGMMFLAKALCFTIAAFFICTMPVIAWVKGDLPIKSSRLDKTGGSVLFGVAVVAYGMFVRKQEMGE